MNSCNTVKAPLASVPKRNSLATDTYGGWIELRLVSAKDSVSGEFIATGYDSLYIMEDARVQGYAISDIRYARVVFFKNMSGAYTAWTVLGSLLTFSNGYFMIFTLPVTIIIGLSTTFAESKRINFLDYPFNSLEDLSKYSRFPQGMPQEINIADLKPRQMIVQ